MADNDILAHYQQADTLNQLVIAGLTCNGAHGIVSDQTYKGGDFPTALATLDNADLLTSTFDGVTLNDGSIDADYNQVFLRYSYQRDGSLDGQITRDDYDAVTFNMGDTSGKWLVGDYIETNLLLNWSTKYFQQFGIANIKIKSATPLLDIDSNNDSGLGAPNSAPSELAIKDDPAELVD